MNTIEKLDDIALIQQFIQGRAKLTFNHNLRVEPLSDTIQLLTKKGLLLATVNLASQFKIFFVRHESSYWQQINQVLLENHLMPTGIERGLMRYEYHPVPIGSQMNYAEALHIWKIWRNQADRPLDNARINLLIFSHDSWQPIQDITFSKESVFIKTYASEIVVHSCDRVVWISPSEDNKTLPLTQPAISTSPNILEIVNDTSIDPQLAIPLIEEESQISDPKQPISLSSSSAANKNILSIENGRLFIQTIEGEIVIEGSNMRFWFTPPEGQNIIPQPVEVK